MFFNILLVIFQKVLVHVVGDVRTGRIVVCRHLDASLTLGSAFSLRYGEKRCKNDTQSFLLSFQIRTAVLRAVGSILRSATPKERKPASLLGYRFSLRRVDKKDATHKYFLSNATAIKNRIPNI